MLFRTHLAFGFLVGLLSLKIFIPNNSLLFFILVLIGSILPDIDHPKSKIGKRIKIVGFLFEHRGFFHSLLFLALVYVVSILFIKNIYFILPLFIGYGSHLLIDCFNQAGIMPLHPLSRFRIKGFIKTGALLETILFFVLIAVDIWKLLNF